MAVTERQLYVPFLLLLCALATFGCGLLDQQITPTPVPTATLTPRPTFTPTLMPTATPEFVMLPPVKPCDDMPPMSTLAQILGAELGMAFTYLPWHYVAEDVEAWVFYTLADEEKAYKAIFRVVDGYWELVETEEITDEEPQGVNLGEEVRH